MKIAAAYIRVSTDDQIEFSPESQIKKIREYAKNNDMLLPNEYIFADEGISGKHTKNRTEFNRMIGLAKTKPTPFEVILVWKFSRFARNREDSIVYKSMLRKDCGIQVISISESLGDDKTSILIEAFIEAMDEYYSINLAEEVRRGMAEKASRGGVVSSAPFGYSLQSGNYVPNEDAMFVRQIFEDFIAGEGMRALASRYGALGVRTTRGNLPDNRFIEYLLRNPVYAGKIRWCANGRGASKRDYDNPNNIIANGQHEPLISVDTFEAAQKRLAALKSMYGKWQRREQPIPYMLKGLMRCSSCGATLVYTSTKCPSLQCHEYARGKCHTSHALSVAKANRSVIAAMKSDVEQLSFNVTPKTRKISGGVDVDVLIKKERVKLERARTAYTEGIDTLDEYRQNKEKILAKISELESANTAPQESFDVRAYAKKVTGVIGILEDQNISPDAKNKALRSIISQIIFRKANNSLEIEYYI